MPLSEQEQRLLDEMERHLMGNDADVVTADRSGRSLSYRNLVLGALLVIAGLAGIIAGVASQLIFIGVIGFVVMLGGVVLAVTPLHSTAPREQKAQSPKPQRSSFMDRMNDRWDRRQGQ
jgi:predicted phage tail protein